MGALTKLTNMDDCLEQARPGGAMWGMQSDWMIGECVAQAGFQPLHQKRRGIFNQFACESKANASKRLVAISCACRPAQCSESCCGSQEALDDDDTYFSAPATVHPVKHAETIGLLHRQFPRASNEAVHDVGEALRKLLATTNTLLAAEITSATTSANNERYNAK